MGPLVQTITSLYGRRGWSVIAAFAAVLFVLVPVGNLVFPPDSALHISTFWVTLIGTIMCYAMVALAMDLIF